MSIPVKVTVVGLGGPRCNVEAFSDWTIQQVQEKIFQVIGVPVGRQILLKGTEELGPEAVLHTLASLTDAPADVEVTLTLVVDEADPVTAEELREAFKAVLHSDSCNEEAIQTLLGLLGRRRVSGLHDRSSGRKGWGNLPARIGLTYLQCVALKQELQDIGCAMLARPDFKLVNAKGYDGYNPFEVPLLHDGTALHFAASHGCTRLCRAIIDREDFVELDACWSGWDMARANGWDRNFPPGETAAEVALRCGHHEIYEMLVAARAKRDAGVRAD